MPLRVRNLLGRAVVRDGDEDERTSTPLELFFDLTFVVAVGRVAAGFHHEIAAGHTADGIVGFVTLFLAVWWAWMNFTWFATGHDADDVPYRVLTFVQIAGALVFAIGVSRAMEDGNFAIVAVGYVIMRLGLVVDWLRVARDEPAHRPRALRFAVAITVVQVLWVARLAIDSYRGALAAFVVLFGLELLIPLWAERAAARTPFHPAHIVERYGLFTIIVLGESVLSAANGLQEGIDEVGVTARLVAIGVAAMVLAFSAWWLYFDHPGHLAPTPATAFRWGYAHVLVFATLAAMGAGIHIAAGAATGHGPSPRIAALAVALPTAGYLLGLAVVTAVVGFGIESVRIWPKVLGLAVVLLGGLVLPLTGAVIVSAAVLAALVAWMVLSGDARSVHRDTVTVDA